MRKGFLQKAAALSAKSGSAFRDSRLHFRPESGTKEFFRERDFDGKRDFRTFATQDPAVRSTEFLT